MVKLLHPKQIFMTAAMLFASVSSFAYDFEVDGIYYNKLSDSTVEVTHENDDYKGYPTKSYCGNMKIPSEVSFEGVSYSVTSIGSDAFCYCEVLTSIEIPEGVTLIGLSAFCNCSELEAVKIPTTVQRIEQHAFTGCEKLKSVYLSDVEKWCSIEFPDYGSGNPLRYGANMYLKGELVTSLELSCSRISDYAFYGCRSLISLSISTKEIGEGAFLECYSLKSVTFKRIDKIGEYAFYNGTLENVVFLSEPPRYVCQKSLDWGSIIYVPKNLVELYKEMMDIWMVEYDIRELEAKCKAPIITFDNDTKKLVFTSATDGAECYYTITSDDINTSEKKAGEATMTGVYTITAYASAEGMYNSEKTTAKLCWVSAAIESDGILTAKADRGVVVSSNADQITISGTVSGETIEVYNVGGSKVKAIKVTGESTTISGLQSCNVYIIKIGGTKVKVAM